MARNEVEDDVIPTADETVHFDDNGERGTDSRMGLNQSEEGCDERLPVSSVMEICTRPLAQPRVNTSTAMNISTRSEDLPDITDWFAKNFSSGSRKRTIQRVTPRSASNQSNDLPGNSDWFARNFPSGSPEERRTTAVHSETTLRQPFETAIDQSKDLPDNSERARTNASPPLTTLQNSLLRFADGFGFLIGFTVKSVVLMLAIRALGWKWSIAISLVLLITLGYKFNFQFSLDVGIEIIACTAYVFVLELAWQWLTEIAIVISIIAIFIYFIKTWRSSVTASGQSKDLSDDSWEEESLKRAREALTVGNLRREVLLHYYRDVSRNLKERTPGIVAILAIWTLDWQWSIAVAFVLYIFFGDRFFGEEIMYSASFLFMLKLAWQWLTETAIVLSVIATALSVTFIAMYKGVHDWSTENNWLVPPTVLIGSSLGVLRDCKAIGL